MEKPALAAVVLGTYNRAHLLRRSLECYARQTHRGFHLIVFDDGSTDETEKVCQDAVYEHGLRIDYTRLEKEPGTWRDSAQFLNAGIAKALHHFRADFVFITHPEIMPAPGTLETGIRILRENPGPVRVNMKGYYLTPAQQEALDTVNWREHIANVRSLPDFYTEGDRHHGHPDYKHHAIDRAKIWFSWIFGGFSRMGWEKFGGVFESPAWGAVDVEMFERCRQLGIPTITPQDDNALVLHQNHDLPTDVQTPRDENTWKRALNNHIIEARPYLISKGRWAEKAYRP